MQAGRAGNRWNREHEEAMLRSTAASQKWKAEVGADVGFPARDE